MDKTSVQQVFHVGGRGGREDEDKERRKERGVSASASLPSLWERDQRHARVGGSTHTDGSAAVHVVITGLVVNAGLQTTTNMIDRSPQHQVTGLGVLTTKNHRARP